MRAEVTRALEEFKPIQVTFTLESQQEVEEMYTLCNYAVITDALASLEHSFDTVRTRLTNVCDGEPKYQTSFKALDTMIRKKVK